MLDESEGQYDRLPSAANGDEEAHLQAIAICAVRGIKENNILLAAASVLLPCILELHK